MNDEEYGVLLLRPLDGEPDAPSRIDVARAMSDGRRMRRRHWWTAGPALAAVTATAVAGGVLATDQDRRPRPVLPPEPPVPAACAIDLLPMGRHTSAEVSAGDTSGRWLVGMSDPMTPEPAVPQSLLVWRDGKLVTDLRPPAAGVRMTDINASGVAVGMNDIGTDFPHVYRDGKLSRLAGGPGSAWAINDAGVIVGQVGTADQRPVRWQSPTAQPAPLPLPDGARPAEADIRDIAADGTIVGTVGGEGYLWRPDGTGLVLTPPRAKGGLQGSFEPLVFRYGWIYGEVRTPERDGPGATSLTWRYEPRTRTWEQLGRTTMETQIGGVFGGFGSASPTVYVGRSVLSLPGHTASAGAGMDSYIIQSVSADARVVAGTAESGRADPSKPGAPIIWRCR